ncbi:ABC transporter ATP-binding protein [Pseudobacteriovorax antillogorgiicola]|uniref:ABC-type lipoprotein export system, ATPase component n=1 Tax=Pseudobacteriovorax antillogorgiicola TaxID=1513793 RepID=A0A1Y6BZ10_9BACT|nr:ATP-binding cassette domain-containing protein [Pseudobacteriovorax antillogorgiicola]TCS51236.1 ABC-type lipoprotein export system ATPase subunit [Pseudobacteriovorax antillogorgiicola]SMF36802.1 ABC-type lipoprotein export system, ATPase component [Pseudobacteriovorax antillogorgiicola]
MIEIRDLKIDTGQGQSILSIDYLRITTRQVVGIIGASGSGKTSLLRCLAGQKPPKSGDVVIGGQSIYELPLNIRTEYCRSHMAKVGSEPNLLQYLNIEDNILVPRHFSHKKPRVNLARHLLQYFSMDGLQRNYPSSLSKGEQQRVAICRSLCLERRIVLADEPMSHLDPDMREKTLESLINICRDRSTSLIISTHDYSDLSMLDHVYQIELKELKPCR